MKKLFKNLFVGALAVASVVGLASCDNEADSTKGSTSARTSFDEDDIIKVKVGVCGGNNLHWNATQKVLDDQDSGIIIELVEYSAYNLPNAALNNKEIDLNSFQHQVYLDKEVEANNYKIETIGQTLIAPLTIYSKNYKTLDELKNGTGTKKVGIPADATNQGRALKVLEAAGLITVDPAKGYLPENKESDILSNPYNLEIVTQNADTLTKVYSDYAACLINGTYAIPYGLSPSKDGLFTETQQVGETNPYVNIIVARSEDKNNETYKTIVKAFQSQLVAEFIIANYNEAFFPSFTYSTTYQYIDTEAKKESFINEIKSYKSKYLNN